MAAVDAVARRYGLAGEVLVAWGDRVLLDYAYGPIAPAGSAMHRPGERWRLASITKQVTAALIVREYAQSGTSLDTPVDYPWTPGLTMRQLLTHHTGLANPDDSRSDAAGVPSQYKGGGSIADTCASKAPRPGAAFAYNNCDYVVAAQAALAVEVMPHGGRVGAESWSVVRGLRYARWKEKGVAGFVGGKPEPAFDLGRWGEAGALMGTARAVFAFDRSLMTGKLVPPALRDGELWKPEGNGSYQALGAWVFPGQLAGCAAPKRIIQRDGEIYGVQARNYILPDDDVSVVVFTNRSADDFPIGEVWAGKGFAYDLLSAAVGC